MAATCIPFTQILSSAVYLNTKNRYKSKSLFKKNLQFLPNLQRRVCPPPLILRGERFKFSLNAKHGESEKKDDHGKDEKGEEEKEKEKDEYKALEMLVNMYTEIKNQNKNGIAEEIGDERQCFSNFLSTFRFRGKKQVLAFFHWLMTTLGSNIKLVVRPKLMDKSTIGVQWQLDWVKPSIMLGKGYGIHICHFYQGKLMIRSLQLQKCLKMFMEPILSLEHLRLRIIASAVSLTEKISAYMRPAESVRKQAANVLLLLALLLFALAIVLFSKTGFD